MSLGPIPVPALLGALGTAATVYTAIKASDKPSMPKMPDISTVRDLPKPEEKITDTGEIAAETARRRAARRRGYMATLLTPLGQSSVTTGVRKSLLGE